MNLACFLSSFHPKRHTHWYYVCWIPIALVGAIWFKILLPSCWHFLYSACATALILMLSFHWYLHKATGKKKNGATPRWCPVSSVRVFCGVCMSLQFFCPRSGFPLSLQTVDRVPWWIRQPFYLFYVCQKGCEGLTTKKNGGNKHLLQTTNITKEGAWIL